MNHSKIGFKIATNVEKKDIPPQKDDYWELKRVDSSLKLLKSKMRMKREENKIFE